jgi:hypothetical protein
MKEIVLKLCEFDELSKDSQEKIIERERWNVMEQCMDAYSIEYQESMKAFEDMTDTRVYNWKLDTRDMILVMSLNTMILFMNILQIIIVIYSLRIYAVNYCSGISITTLCHISRKVNIIL